MVVPGTLYVEVDGDGDGDVEDNFCISAHTVDARIRESTLAITVTTVKWVDLL
jgi:hypothetical protein